MTSIDEAIQLFEQYAEKLNATHGAEFVIGQDLISEVRERLKQMGFVLAQLNHLDSLVGQVVMVETLDEQGMKSFFNANAERDQQNFFLMRLLTESFYYFAFRVRQILRNDVSPFPHLSPFEAPGVRDVRNHLIEHPEGKSSRVFSQTFSYTPGSGMHLKSGRKESEAGRHEDSGLAMNAGEFVANLTTKLKSAIESLDRAVPR